MHLDPAQKTWTREDVPMPPLGAVDVAASDFESQIFLNYEGFLTLTNSFSTRKSEAPRPLKSTPERFAAGVSKLSKFVPRAQTVQ